MNFLITYWKTAFLTGLAVILPAALSIGVVIWLFGAAANFTDSLLFLVPKDWTHAQNGNGPTHLYWSLIALTFSILLVGLVGGLASCYLGRKLIQLTDIVFMRVPLLNKIYITLKQIHQAFTSNKTSTFKQVALVEFPRPGFYSLCFITNDQNVEIQTRLKESMVCVFVPSPPLTSGSIVLVPEANIIKLDMSVADGIKFIMSLGSVSPAYSPLYAASNTFASKSCRFPENQHKNNTSGWHFISPIHPATDSVHYKVSHDHSQEEQENYENKTCIQSS